MYRFPAFKFTEKYSDINLDSEQFAEIIWVILRFPTTLIEFFLVKNTFRVECPNLPEKYSKSTLKKNIFRVHFR